MKVILHLTSPDDAILAVRAAILQWKDGAMVGVPVLIEYENGQQFQVTRNKTSFSVWRLADAP